MVAVSILTRVGMVRRDLFRQPLRATLTILGVSLGVVAIVTMGALIQGIERTIDSGIKLGGADLIVFQAGVVADMLSTLDEKATRAKLLADPDVERVAAGMSHVMPVGNQRFTVVYGVESDGFTSSSQYLRGGPVREAEDVALGSLAAKTFGKDVGDTIEIVGQSFHVVSVYETGVIVYDAAITLRIDTLQKILHREGQATAFFVGLKRGADVRAVIHRLEQNHPELVGISSAAEYKKVDAGSDLRDGAVWAITIAAVVIGSVIVLNTMWMTVLERTREIGVLRAVGWSRRDVLRLIMIESLFIGAAALVVGSLLGVLLAQLIALLPIASQFIRPSFGLAQFLIAAAAAIVLSAVGGAIPAWRAGRISPAEALRYE